MDQQTGDERPLRTGRLRTFGGRNLETSQRDGMDKNLTGREVNKSFNKLFHFFFQ